MSAASSLARDILRPTFPDHAEEIVQLLPGGGHGDFDLECIELTCGLVSLGQLVDDPLLDRSNVVLGQLAAPCGRGDIPVNADHGRHEQGVDHLRLIYRGHPKFLHFLLRFHGAAPSFS